MTNLRLPSRSSFRWLLFAPFAGDSKMIETGAASERRRLFTCALQDRLTTTLLKFKIRLCSFAMLPTGLLAGLCVAWLAFACTERARDNPLDPRNPDTRGRLPAPTLLSFADTVVVRWNRIDIANLAGYRIYRRLENESSYGLIAEVAPPATQYTETGVEFEVSRYYRITARTADFETPLSDSSRIRPGPSFLWAVDGESDVIAKYTHDGEHIVFRTSGGLRPYRMAVHPTAGYILVSDLFTNEIARINRNGREEARLVVDFGENFVEIDTVDNHFWVLNVDVGSLKRYSETGAQRFSLLGLAEPRVMKINPFARTVWIIERGRGRIVELSRAGDTISAFPGYHRANDLALHIRANRLWIADSNAVRIYSLDRPREPISVPGFTMPVRIAVDEQSGDAWVVDWLNIFGDSRIVKVSSQGQIMLERSGFFNIRAVVVNPFNGHCFAAEAGQRRLLQFSPTGELLSTVATRGGLIDLAIEPGKF